MLMLMSESTNDRKTLTKIKWKLVYQFIKKRTKSAAKNAIMGFTRSLAVSLGPEVRVNCIAPGWIRTGWGEQASDQWQERVLQETPLNRWGTPEDIAKLTRFLVSPDASYITGQVINCNGGAVR